ncbi:MAG TPA: glutamine--fructose-6-phosphate transaminase (isomerizing) [Candidatus Caldiarchaeum subterraneum]|uniref:Glutamine--fructose-6-phosphate aminotransferase [isomerizing] n=1 Tax=Caldiarchaeum subterraneum TaxID=311458 RepID=A0A832ZXP4_CALS0|nr:glutamine--fructose-6-phosphate transaminase (isomerizing) [Candidatus Caldarchaeum subterraneum]
MCGIVGYIGSENAAPVLHRALTRLEYRGYDSAGIATVFNGRVFVKKDSGRIEEIHKRLNLDDMPGGVGIAHTRWATHGGPSQANAHPHLDCSNSIAVVHNGVIENFLQLRKELTELNHVFKSKTDTEVIVHLVEEYHVRQGKPLLEAFLTALERIQGSYAVALISSNAAREILVARNDAPLAIGVGDGFNFISSDVTAFIEKTKRAVFLQNGEAAVVRADGYDIIKLATRGAVARKPVTLLWDIEMAEKHGYPHFTLKEIHEQPEALRNALRLQNIYVDLLTELLDRGRDIFLLGAGTSYHACLAGSYLFSKIARVATYPVVASEFVENYGASVNADTVILAVSQSGETADVLNALEHARLRAATILGITNTVGSTLTRISRAYVLQNSGPEIGVAATKTYTAQVLVLTQLALRLAKLRGKLAQFEMDEFKETLVNIPGIVEVVISRVEKPMREVAEKLVDKDVLLFLGRGVSSSTAAEARLKVMELSYIPCISYSAGESKHGPISIIDKGFPVFFIVPPDDDRKQNIGNIMEMKARGAMIIAVADENDDEVRELSDIFIGMPAVHPLLSPIPYVIPFQFLAYYLAILRGNDPDKPRNLAKSVTVL